MANEAQLTQWMGTNDRVEVVGSLCPPPYRCRQCQHIRKERVADPEAKGHSYKTNACDRPDRFFSMSAAQWMEQEAARIGGLPGRSVEIRRDIGRIAVFVNDVSGRR